MAASVAAVANQALQRHQLQLREQARGVAVYILQRHLDATVALNDAALQRIGELAALPPAGAEPTAPAWLARLAPVALAAALGVGVTGGVAVVTAGMAGSAWVVALGLTAACVALAWAGAWANHRWQMRRYTHRLEQQQAAQQRLDGAQQACAELERQRPGEVAAAQALQAALVGSEPRMPAPAWAPVLGDFN